MSEERVDPAMAIVRRALDVASTSHPDPVDAADAVCARLGRSLVRSIGGDGWRILLQRGLVEARRHEPVLHEVAIDYDGRLRWVSRPVVGDAPVTDALASLLVAVIQLLGRLVGRDLAVHLLLLGLPEIDDA